MQAGAVLLLFTELVILTLPQSAARQFSSRPYRPASVRSPLTCTFLR